MSQIPLIQKVYKTNSFYVEKTLPDIGTMFVKAGDKVEPFSRVGGTKVSFFFLKIDPGFTITKPINTYIEKGLQIAEKKVNALRVKKMLAPYNGFIRSVGDGTFVFEQEKETYMLLSGLWGVVMDVVENKAALVKGSATVIYGAVSTPFEAEGELIVLPNPSELLEDPYFNNFTKEIAGKIIYSGYFIKPENLKKAIDLGARGVITGGCDKDSLDFATKSGLALVSLSGYGRIPTPVSIYELLNSVTNRYIFIRGQRGQILIPSENPLEEPKQQDKAAFNTELKSGIIVQVLERPYFGWMGIVEGIEEKRVLVRLLNGVEVINVKASNLVALSV